MTTRTRAGSEQDTYLLLVKEFPLRPIRSDAALVEARRMIDKLVDRLDDLEEGERDYLDVLADLVERYEKATIPMPRLPDQLMLRFLLDAKEVSQSQLAKDTGIAVSTISEVLAGKRKLTRSQVEQLARYFHVGPGVFSCED